MNFIPKNLFSQFTKLANTYFLIMMLLELIPAISDSGGFPVLLFPLGFVVMVSMIKDAYEDYQRHKSDMKENRSKVLVGNVETRSFEERTWADIQVGNIIKIEQDQLFPADLILVNSSEPKGICYIETKNLDGETNLKHKKAQKETVELSANDSTCIKEFGRGWKVECEMPNEFLHRFDGVLRTVNTNVLISPENFLLRGSNLRNTEFIYGIVVFTGHETKVMKNSMQSKMKYSKVERMTNTYIFVIMVV